MRARVRRLEPLEMCAPKQGQQLELVQGHGHLQSCAAAIQGGILIGQSSLALSRVCADSESLMWCDLNRGKKLD